MAILILHMDLEEEDLMEWTITVTLIMFGTTQSGTLYHMASFLCSSSAAVPVALISLKLSGKQGSVRVFLLISMVI
jgi:hypothetical protein